MTHKMNRCSVALRQRLKLSKKFKYSAPALLVLMLLPTLLFADIYRCKSASGVITYSDEPCGENAVVAFENRAMTVEYAASRDIIGPNTNRMGYDSIEKDIIAHAKQVGSCILPDQKLSSFLITKSSTSCNVIDWTVSMQFGSNDFESQWEIKIFYKGNFEFDQSSRLRRLNTLRLRSINTSKDENPFDPISMKKMRTFRKVQTGEWEYLRQ